MPGKGNSYDDLARTAAARIEAARDQGQQLTFLPDEAEGEGERPARGKGRALNQMREFLAARGYRAPEEVLVEMAGLASRDDAVLTAMRMAEQVLTWAFADATDKKGNPVHPSPHQRLDQFQQLYTVQLRAADALMPYGTPKAVPVDDAGKPIVPVIVAAAPSQAPDRASLARDVTPVLAHRMMPADVAWKMQKKQDVTDAQSEVSDGDSRTDEVSD